MSTIHCLVCPRQFAFVIAVYSVDNGLIQKDLYASLVLAVLLSTIFPPFFLRGTIGYYNKRAEAAIQRLADEELKRKHDLETSTGPTSDLSERETQLVGQIQNETAVFLCIQTQSMAKWGLLTSMMSTLTKLGLDIIDHRCWNPRGINTTLVTEVYARDNISVEGKGDVQAVLEERMEKIKKALEDKINQPNDSRVKVQRWYPGVVEEIVSSVHETRKTTGTKKLNLEERLLIEAEQKLTKSQDAQTKVTKERTVEEILAGMKTEPELPGMEEGRATAKTTDLPAQKKVRRRRQKMRSTPVVGGGLFGETGSDADDESVKGGGKVTATGRKPGDKEKPFFLPSYGHKAEIVVGGDSYRVRINDETLRSLQTGFTGDMLDTRGVSIGGGISVQQDRSNVVNQLQGYVRNFGGLGSITEEEEQSVDESDTSSMIGNSKVDGKQAEEDV